MAPRRILADPSGKWHGPAQGLGPPPNHRPSQQRGTALFAKINHVAIVSEKYALLASFYESLFGMKRSPKGKINRAVTVGDGYVGLNINRRKPGPPARLDHFGLEVEDVGAGFDRMRTRYPGADSRPFAGITANDPDGNVFDLSQKQM